MRPSLHFAVDLEGLNSISGMYFVPQSQAALFAALIEAVLFVGSTNRGEMHLNEAVGFGACRAVFLVIPAVGDG